MTEKTQTTFTRAGALALVISIFFGLSSFAVAASMPAGAFLIVDGELHEIPLTAGEDDIKAGSLEAESDGEWQVSISGVLDPDPSILYSGSIIDFGAPSTFGFIFTQAIVPTDAPGIARHSHSSSTTVGSGGSTPVTALAPPAGVPVDGDAITEIAVYTLSTNGGASLLSPGLDLSPSFVGAAPSDSQGTFNEGPVAGPAGSGTYDLMRIDVNFRMNGGNDLYTFNGKALIIPEPSTLLILLPGIVLLALGRRYR